MYDGKKGSKMRNKLHDDEGLHPGCKLDRRIARPGQPSHHVLSAAKFIDDIIPSGGSISTENCIWLWRFEYFLQLVSKRAPMYRD